MIWRIRSRKVFAEFQTHGQRTRSGSVSMTFVAVPTTHPQLALALGRRFGNAVDRNRGRRRLRAAFGTAWSARSADRGATPAGAFLLSGSRRLLRDPFDSIVTSIISCLDQLESRLDRGLDTSI
ncbi:MAG: ribonuclease P protein component [Actinomycetia bacterium]|nr:ribonuclease P protein component [Actinomycetes bacterium]MCP5033387.1 ribonuclease P protein component [Actinomycetes bacterium]